MSKSRFSSKKRQSLEEDEENALETETIPLSPTPLLLFDDEGQIVDPNSLNREPLTILSPPQQPRRQPTPFRDASIDRRAKTPMMQEMTAPRTSNSTARSSLSSLNHSSVSTATTRHSYSPPTDALPHTLSEDASSALFGEGITFDEESSTGAVSSVADSAAAPTVFKPRVSFDLEAGLLLNSPAADSRGYHSDASVLSPDEHDDDDVSIYSSQEQREEGHIASLLRTWGMQLNREIIRGSHVTTNELTNLLRVARERVFGGEANSEPSSPTASQLVQDLTYLQTMHREKVGQLTHVEHDDHFDFALVLTPQAVYEFWADLLDFRAEQLGQEAVDNGDESSPQTQGTLETENSDEAVMPATEPDTIDSRPFLTPLTGMRRRRGRLSSTDNDETTTPVVKETPKPPPSQSTTAGRESNFPYSSSMMSVNGSGRRVVKSRLSMFERAVGGGAVSPSMRPSFGSKRSLYDTTTPTPNIAEKTPVTSRRRWGNRNIGAADGATTPDIMSPPVRALLRRHSSLKKRRATTQRSMSVRSTPFQEDDKVTTTGKRRKCDKNSIRIEDIPTQVIPRGIAARTNGMMQFLSALKRGIVVRRHRPGAEATFCKIISTDGGDTIKYQHVEEEEAMLALKEQRVRYNHKRYKRLSPSSGPRGVEPRSIEKKWSQRLFDESDEMQTFSLPDFIAAKQYRQQMLKEQVGVSKKMNDLATKVANSGIVRVADLIAVHAARHEDPRSENGELGTASLRRSKSEYYAPHTFSLVSRAARSLGKGKLSNSGASEKWHAGEGTEAQFKTVDLEAATEGEYWLIFRGFLLLHRDAASGRYAAHRAAGFGPNYTGKGSEENSLQSESSELVLHKDEFREPPTVSYMERLVVRARKIDASYMEGYVAPTAVPPPSDYFLGFSSPGTQVSQLPLL